MIADISSGGTECEHHAPPALQWWDHQRRWLEDDSRLRVCCKARQIGMSTTLATEALHAAVYGETTVILSKLLPRLI
jgi:phage FluMu gp28-like protein